MHRADLGRPITSVLFDIDGTLVDSNDAHARAWVDACSRAGFAEVDFATVRPLIGLGGDALIAALPIGLDPHGAAGTALAADRKAVFLDRYLASVRPTPGAREVVEAVKARGMRAIVASAGSSEEMEPLLALSGAGTLFDHIVRPDDVAASKPDPDIVQAALRWAPAEPDRAVMIGDTRFDIAAAHGAGVRCIALRCGGAPAPDLNDADAVFDSPLALAAAIATAGLDELIGRLAV